MSINVLIYLGVEFLKMVYISLYGGGGILRDQVLMNAFISEKKNAGVLFCYSRGIDTVKWNHSYKSMQVWPL